MKKFVRTLISVATVLSLALVPVAVHAQDPIEIGSGDTTAPVTTPATAATTPATPDTGVAPQSNKVMINSAIFLGGSALGAAVALGYLSLRKKHSN